MTEGFDSIETALKDFLKGKPLIVVDDENRENEGDLIVAGEKCSPEVINFMIKEGKGLVCVPLTEEKARQLNLNLMISGNKELHKCNFTVSIDALKDSSTGISAFDRAKTVQEIVRDNSTEKDFTKPGHIFPLIARKGGLFERQGHTEASIELCKLTGLKEVAVICEIIKENGEMARVSDLIKFKEKHGLKLISIVDLIRYLIEKTKIIKKEVETKLPTKFGEFKLIAFQSLINDFEHLVLVKGEITGKENVLIRIHSECLTGDLFSSMRCDCQNQLHYSMQKIQEKGEGLILYLRQEGRGIGLLNKLKAYALQDQGLDTVEANLQLGFRADERNYLIAAKMLKELQVKSIELMTNNPSKIFELEKFGIKVVQRHSIHSEKNKFNEPYLKTKKDKLGHLIEK